jgi:hypothetical protein
VTTGVGAVDADNTDVDKRAVGAVLDRIPTREEFALYNGAPESVNNVFCCAAEPVIVRFPVITVLSKVLTRAVVVFVFVAPRAVTLARDFVADVVALRFATEFARAVRDTVPRAVDVDVARGEDATARVVVF